MTMIKLALILTAGRCTAGDFSDMKKIGIKLTIMGDNYCKTSYREICMKLTHIGDEYGKTSCRVMA